MKQESFTTIILRAEEGKYLTQAYDVDISERVIGPEIALGRNDSPKNWKEITKEEADKIKEEKETANLNVNRLS